LKVILNTEAQRHRENKMVEIIDRKNEQIRIFQTIDHQTPSPQFFLLFSFGPISKSDIFLNSDFTLSLKDGFHIDRFH
jgi:hypothetical protein